MVDVNQQAHKDAADLEMAFTTGDPAQTWAKLKADLDSHKSNSPDDIAYNKAMAKELSDRGLMPAASALMLQQDFDKMDVNTSDGVTAKILDLKGDTNSYADPFHQAALKYLKDHYSQLSNQSEYGDFGISKENVDKAIAKSKAQWQGQSAAAQLLADNGKLFDALDIAHEGGTPDGKISIKDLEDFLNNQTNKTHFTKEQMDAVQYLKDHFDDSDVQLDEHNWFSRNKITKDSLVKALGYNSLDEMQKGIAARQAIEASDAHPDVSTAAASGGGGLDQAHARALMNASADGKLKGVADPDTGAVTLDNVKSILNKDQTDGGKDLTQEQRDTFTYLRDNWDKVAPNGTLMPADVKNAANMSKDDYVAWRKQRDTDHAALVDALSKTDLSKIAKDGVVNKTDLETQMQTLQPDSDDYKRMKLIDDNFNKISHDGKAVSLDDIKAFTAKATATASTDNGSSTPGGAASTDDATAARDQFMTSTSDAATQVQGEGPYAAAGRLADMAGGADPKTVLALAHLLKKSYQQHNKDNTDTLDSLPVGYQWVNKDNINELLKDPTFKQIYDKINQSGDAANTGNTTKKAETVAAARRPAATTGDPPDETTPVDPDPNAPPTA